jgi:hypothetical protein
MWQGAQGTCKRATVERPGSIFVTPACATQAELKQVLSIFDQAVRLISLGIFH